MGMLALRPLLLRSVVVSALGQAGLALWFLWSAERGRAGENCRVYHDCAGVGLTYSLVVEPFLLLAAAGGFLAVLLRARITRPKNVMATGWLILSWLYVAYFTWPFVMSFFLY